MDPAQGLNKITQLHQKKLGFRNMNLKTPPIASESTQEDLPRLQPPETVGESEIPSAGICSEDDKRAA